MPPPMGPSRSPCGGLPVEEVSAWELSNIVIRDPLENAPRMDRFGEHREGCGAEAPADTFCIDTALFEESMEQASQSDLEEEGSESPRVGLLREHPMPLLLKALLP